MNSFGSDQPQEILDLQRRMSGGNYAQEIPNFCGFCNDIIQSEEEEILLQTTECFHMVHLKCFKERSMHALINEEPLQCPDCFSIVDRVEMESVLQQEEKNHISDQLMKKYMESCGLNLATCPCGSIMEVSPGVADYNSKDDKGQVMSFDACNNMAAYRIRCRDCEETFCSNCKA